jgi:hypothetical protein
MDAVLRCIVWLVVVVIGSGSASAQHIPGYNYDESRVPSYTPLDPLRLNDGRPVTTRSEWWDTRRPEIMHLFEENIYGRTPTDAKAPLRLNVIEMDRHALSGRAIRKQIDLYFTSQQDHGLKMRLLVYLPVHAHRKTIVILGLNFSGNQTVFDDLKIQPTPVWIKPKGAPKVLHQLPDDATRGTQMQEWQIEKILSRGYGLATAYYGDIEPDFKDSAQFGIRSLFLEPDQQSSGDNWGAIGAWAWGLSRAIDYLVTDQDIDPHRIFVTGHSRLGKVADWAAAQDLRIAGVLSTESGKGGQSISRREMGENVYHLQHSFPYWFCPNYAQWVGHDREIPADGNLLLSLIAPRPLYAASAAGDEWSDPKGEFLSVVSASRVYAFLGKPGIPPRSAMPAVDQPLIMDNVAYHLRSGKHDVTAFDWEQYLNFLDKQFGRQTQP